MSNTQKQENNTNKVAKPLIQSQIAAYNFYPDLKNKWAPSALEHSYSISELFCFFFVVFMLGWLSSQLLMFAFKSQTDPERQVEIIQPIYSTKIEETSEYINYASSINGAKIIYEHSTPELHGWFSLISNNKLESLLSDDNWPENCWAIMGKKGYAAIRLSHEIIPEKFSIVLPKKFFETIPKQINVYSYTLENCEILSSVEVVLSKFDKEIRPQIVFDCNAAECGKPVETLIVEVTENYGSEFTCLYQFKAYGKLSQK